MATGQDYKGGLPTAVGSLSCGCRHNDSRAVVCGGTAEKQRQKLIYIGFGAIVEGDTGTKTCNAQCCLSVHAMEIMAKTVRHLL